MTRIQPWTHDQLMQHEQVFEALVGKAVRQTVRHASAQVRDGVLTAATLPLEPSFTALEGSVQATWQGYVDQQLFPFLTDTFMTSVDRVVDGVAETTGAVVDPLTNTYASEFLQYAYNRMVATGEQLWEKIRAELSAGFEAGESIDQIAARLTSATELALPRALTVARTEIISAANAGSYLQMLDTGFDEPVTKVWLATEGDRTRLSHRHADDQGVLLTDEFSVDIYNGDVKTGTEGMEFPGDPVATPGNIINCRCSLAFDFSEDEDVLVAAKKFIEKHHPRDGDGKFKKKGAADKYVKVPDVADKPANSAPMVDKVAWMAAHKWDSMTAGQKGVLIKNIDEPTWQKLPPVLKEKILDAPATTSHPEAKNLLEQDVAKLQGFQDEPDDEPDTDAPAKRPQGGVVTKTGKAWTPGAPTALKVQLLFNTTFEDGAVMAVKKDTNERVVWNGATQKVDRQVKGPDGKYATTESLTRGALYKKYKDEDGWTIPTAADMDTETAAPAPAVGKATSIKVQLIYQTPFDDGDVVAVHPTSGDFITWDAKKKRMVVHHGKGGTTEYTRGALYKEYKDADGWHLPLDKKVAPAAPAPAPAKKFAPPAKSAAPKAAAPAKKPFQPVPSIGGENNDKLKAALVDFDVPIGTVLFDQSALGQKTTIKKGALGEADVVVNNGDTVVVKANDALDTLVWIKAINDSKASGKAKDAALVETGTDVSDYVASDASNQIYQAWDTGAPGEIYTDGDISVALAKNGNLLFLDATPNGGVGLVQSQDVNSENIDKALAAVKAGHHWKNGDPIPEIDPAEISAPGGSDGVSAGDVEDFQEKFDSVQVGDMLFENSALEVEKLTDTQIMITEKVSGNNNFKSYDVEDVTAEHLNDFVELFTPVDLGTAPVSTVGPQAQAIFEDYNDATPGMAAFLLQDGTFKVKKASSGNVLIYDTSDDIVGGLYAKDVTPENLEKGIAAVKAGLDFQYGDPIPDVPDGPPEVFDQYLTDLVAQKADDDSLFPLSTLWQDGDVSVIKGGNGSIGVNVNNKGFITLNPDEITPAKINQAIADALAGKKDYKTAPPALSSLVVTKDKAATLKDWAKQSDITAGEELHNGINFKVVKASPGAVVVYPKNAAGDIDTNKGVVLFGDEITAEGIQNAVNEATSTPSVATPAAANLTVTGKTLTSPSAQKPLEMSYGLLVNPKTTGAYKDGQIIAENPAQGERLVWDGINKKFLVQVQGGSGDWTQVHKYSKQAAYKNLKGDPGWVTPSTMFATAGPGATPGSAPTPTLTSHMVNISTKSSAATKDASSKKLTFDIDQLNAASDAKIDAISDADAKKVFNEFKTGKSTMYLTSSESDLLDAVLRAQKKHNAANPGVTLNMLETIALVDKESAKVAGVANGKLYQKKMLDWLGTPAGKKKASEVIAEFRMTPAEKAKIIADKAAAAKAELDIKLKSFHAIRPTLGVPEIRPKNAKFEAPSLSQALAAQTAALAKKPWTASQKSALKKYTGNYYHTLNGMLRGKIAPTDQVVKDASEAQKGMRPLERDMLLFRGTGEVPGLFPGNLADYQSLIGKTATEPGFFSTSLNKPFGGKIKIEFEAPKGTPAAFVENYTDTDGTVKKLTNVSGENEVLLAAGTRFEYVSVQQIGYQIVVRVRVVP